MLGAAPGLETARLIAALGEGDAPDPAVADLLAQGGERSLPELLRALATTDDRIRDGAVLALASTGRVAWPSLVTRLRDPSRRVRVGAARALEGSGWTPADPSEEFAYSTVLGDWDAVAGMGAAAIPFLVGSLNDPHPAVREEAARALGRSGDRAAVRPLAGLLASDPEEEVREAAARALGVLADPGAVPALRTALDDRSSTVRLAAATSLDGLGWHPAGDDETAAHLAASGQWAALAGLGAAAVPRLLRGLDDDSYGVRRGAGSALITLGAVARPALEQARSDPSPAVREEAESLLARLGPFSPGDETPPTPAPEPEPAVEPVPAPDVPPTPPSLADLAGLLYAGDPAGRRAAASALAAMPPDRAVPALAGALLDPDPALREAAVGSLGALATPDAMRLLIDRLADPDDGVRGAAVLALARAGAAAVPTLVAALGRSERAVRTGAADLLVRTETDAPPTVGELELAFGLEDWRGIARFGRDAIEPLAAFLVHPDPDLRLGAVIALGGIEGDRAADLLRQASADPSAAVRNRAAQLLHLRRQGS